MSSEITKLRVFGLFALMCILSLGLASAQTSAPDPNPDITARAKDWLHRLQAGDIDRSQLDAAVNAAFTPDVVKQTSQQLAALGDPLSFAFLKQTVSGDVTAYVYQVTFKSGAIDEIFALDKDGKIAGIRFTAAQ
jgi:hypothetical protein